jgi:hypothetical protein
VGLAAIFALGLGVYLLVSGKSISGLLGNTVQTTPQIEAIAEAIARAEGFYVAGTAPSLMHNPGDLSPGDEHGFATGGPPEYHGGSFVIHFATDADGWNALRLKLSNIANGVSAVYSPDMTWNEIASRWAGNSGAWVNNVTSFLGVEKDSTFADYVAA